MQFFDLTNRVAIVTGASQGIGASIAKQLAEAGAKTVIHYRSSQADAMKVAEAIRTSGGVAQVVQADLSDENQVRQMIDQVQTKFGGIDILVNNAGMFPTQSIENMTISEWREMYEANMETAFLCVKHVIPSLEQSDRASIINIASISASHPGPEHSHYNSSKAALVSFTKSAAQELAPKGIRVNCVSPGLIAREGIEESWPDGVKRWLEKAPLARLGKPEDIAMGCLFLASSASAWITGHNLVIDGGISSTGAY
jgi:NAD(P)-dependent dehydrogenase (short-subunit alcohol dehydrogenase family)